MPGVTDPAWERFSDAPDLVNGWEGVSLPDEPYDGDVSSEAGYPDRVEVGLVLGP